MYKLKVNKTYSFDVSKEDIDKLDAVETSEKQFHILNNDKSVKATVLRSDFNKKSYSIKVNNNTYDVVINNMLDQQIEALGFEIGASKQINSIEAPMPGLILEVSVKQGQEVKEDDALLILEAMKMENVINSPRDGVIKSIKVNQGETVDKNSLLIEFE
ncbi:MAG: acetyl-CoA carboxylase biotin carboxyl carrier protein subunit [Winogradskyella sp.]|uniref:acetyl-CoA carboxylase biotin carboxyl carrier protein subunit n=1 Tax=Winogradskyella sp. TaxID=1883156 RepID=UPI0017B4F8D6|nr:acetyl-CoA carboxylase biotin carboxyl carrier protein subunit [Winogradskyella sp.]MBT8244717.1 acetyl-CoA carboxylase biotin carboxyl carrier protein subunit [Winogradskyella sp.]NNK22797.1 acetyl-CoA carboxylase biotin carboxyl carrier protein subunit [Winogradskyella sp.]